MKRNQITTIVLVGVMGILLLVYFIFFYERGKSYQWWESYRADSAQPYGTLFIRNMLEHYRPGSRFVMDDKKALADVLAAQDSTQRADYVFIGGSDFLDEDDTEALLTFVGRGNNAFIASQDAPEALLEKFFTAECGYRITYLDAVADCVIMDFYHDTLRTPKGYRYTYRVQGEDMSYPWHHLAPGIFCDSTQSVVPLGFQRPNQVNFLRVPYRSGNIYLHTNPIVFTNYFLSRKENVHYAAAVFSHLDGKDIIWDEHSKLPFLQKNDAYSSPLYYILQQPSLKYAWWLFLLSVVLYVVFAIKRKERVIPVLEPKTNTSLEYVNQISGLHFENGNHLDMARKKMRYFQYFIRAKYNMTQVPGDREAMILRLAEKAKVNEADVRAIFTHFEHIENKSNIPAYRLVDLYSAIDNFYKNCK